MKQDQRSTGPPLVSVIQLVNQSTRGSRGDEILDLMFTNNSDVVHHVSSDRWESFTDHNVVKISVNYDDDSNDQSESEELIDKSIPGRYNCLNYRKANWTEIENSLNQINWYPMNSLDISEGIIWMHEKILMVLESKVPKKQKKRIQNKKM